MAAPERFWNRIAPRYARQPIADVADYRTKLAKTQALMRPDMTVLEFGCGTGATALLHAPHVASYTAIDFSPAMIGIAGARPDRPANLTFAVAEIGGWVGPEGGYDMVLGLSVLHLMPDLGRTLSQVHRLLAPGGRLVTSTTCIRDRGGVLVRLLPLMTRLGIAPYVAPLSTESLRRAIVAAGFTISETWAPGPGKAVFITAQKPPARSGEMAA